MRAIEDIDAHFIKPFFEQMDEPYTAIIVSDHYTFSDTGGHGGEPSPFMLLGLGSAAPEGRYTEQYCRNAGWNVKAGELVAIQREGGSK